MSTIIKKEPRDAAGYYRSLGLICRQQAARHPEASWTWLSEAERWEEMAVRARDTANGPATRQPPDTQKVA